MKSPYMTTADAAEYLLFVKADGTPNLVALHKFLRRYPTTIRTVKRGRYTLIDRQSLEAHLNRRNRPFQSLPSRFQQRKGAHDGALITKQAVSNIHAADSEVTGPSSPLYSMDSEAAR